ncbi:MAG: hypothetical protein K6G54_00050 [Oscillospiraceae bacterium]|nr:hypothetical protein [Oscillospiraceae bacterium]
MKKSLALLLTLLMLFSLCACAQKAPEAASAPAEAAEAAELAESAEPAEPAEPAAPAETAAPAEAVDTSALKIACPNGAPALALATLAVENPDNYTIVAADTITAEFSNATADFIIAPLNAGAKLYKAEKSTYKLAAVVSWGNLFFASQRADFKLEDINGADITLFGENTINASIALYVLAQNGITPASVSYLAGAANTQQLLLTDANAIVLTAEPALTAARMKNEAITGCAVNELYKAATGNDGYTQAALFVKAELAEEQSELVDAYLKQVEASCEKCSSDLEAVAAAAVALEILPNEKVAMSAIPNCAVRFVAAQDAREQVETTANVDLKQFGGALPADDFYYASK